MSRPVKCRKVCHFPQTLEFIPVQGGDNKSSVILTVDEYECIRLIDKEKLSQTECGEFMQVARTTVQRVYESARKKIADAVVEGRSLKIEGGDFWLCDGNSEGCGNDRCFKHQYYKQYEKSKGDYVMRIAVTYENGQVFQHFGHTEQFKVYDVSDGKIISAEVVDTNGSGHGALAGVLNALKVDALICGGIGGGAQAALAAVGIKLYGGVSGEADRAVENLLMDKLEFNPDIQCSHHEHHGEGHSCGEHGCGSEHHCESK